jgi:L-lactate dehydrogenase complex protein LldE
MHIGGGLERIRAGVRTLHLAEILTSTEGEPFRGPEAPSR